MSERTTVLALNAGSSSIKLGVYRRGDGGRGHDRRDRADATGRDGESGSIGAASGDSTRLTRLLGVDVERIGSGHAMLRVRGGAGAGDSRAEPMADDDFSAALGRAFAEVEKRGWLRDVAGVGHRVVHGGRARMDHQAITPDVVAALRDAVPLARNHMPQALAGIEFVTRSLPGVAQVACFDTAFHRTMSPIARMQALPAAVRVGDRVEPLPVLERFGFHGLSYEYLCAALAEIDPGAVTGERSRLIILHLGNGASIAAIRDGKSVDTSMGFTPNSGLMMGTRCGDIDPGVLTYLLRETKLPLDALEDLLDRQSGLLGVSGSTSDMRELLDRAAGKGGVAADSAGDSAADNAGGVAANSATDRAAADAIALFCHRAIRHVGACVSVLGGVDTVVFSGGIGERSAAIRERICANHAHLGIRIDPVKNAADAPLISAESSAVAVRVIPTDEESMIVRHTLAVLADLATPAADGAPRAFNTNRH